MISTLEMLTGLVACLLTLTLYRFIRRGTGASAGRTSKVRLTRVKNASLVFSVCLCASLLSGGYWFFGFLLGWPGPGHDVLRMVISHNHIYTSPSEMPPSIFRLAVVRQGLAFFAAGVLLRLFWLYGKGILFSAKNVNCIRFLGYCLIVDWFINYQMQGLLRDMDLSTTPIFAGLFIIFFAWIMDEGRKIQEEQELTV
ncbi:MAG TPA: DUF2975 domain-containing protein [Verrucomicrobiae bacterium]|nr:DUF2975 domain-containing protein [Verrucomicrobiae bacterium]